MKRLRTEFKLVRLVALIPSLQIAKAQSPNGHAGSNRAGAYMSSSSSAQCSMDLLSEAP